MAHYNPFAFPVNKKSITKNPTLDRKIREGIVAKNLRHWETFTRDSSVFFSIFQFDQKLTYCKFFQSFRFFITPDSIGFRAIFLARHCRIKYALNIRLNPYSTGQILISLVLISPPKNLMFYFPLCFWGRGLILLVELFRGENSMKNKMLTILQGGD